MNPSALRINRLAEMLSAKSYVEIGVQSGTTFLDVNVPQRTAVDPNFAFDYTPYISSSVSFRAETSDHFFSTIDRTTTYDLIFIDGLHQFEQVARDFTNSIIHSHPRSVIILDDTEPNDIYSASPNMAETMKFRRAAGHQDDSWHGDVYKIVFFIHDFCPALDYKTIVGSGNPQTIVWRSNNFCRKPRFNSLEAISRMTYYQLMENIDILRESEEGAVLEAVIGELT